METSIWFSAKSLSISFLIVSALNMIIAIISYLITNQMELFYIFSIPAVFFGIMGVALAPLIREAYE